MPLYNMPEPRRPVTMDSRPKGGAELMGKERMEKNQSSMPETRRPWIKLIIDKLGVLKVRRSRNTARKEC